MSDQQMSTPKQSEATLPSAGDSPAAPIVGEAKPPAIPESAALEQFKDECAHFPEQYTPEWFARVDSIGGSEMHDLNHRPIFLAVRKIRALLPKGPEKKAPKRASRRERRKDGLIDTMEGADIIGIAKPTSVAPAAAPAAMSGGAAHEDEADGVPSEDEEPDIKVLSMTPGVAMGWGTLFEPLLCNYTSSRLGAPIECRSSSYFKKPWRFSPDGVFRDANGDYALLEMKNPFVRVWSSWSAENNDSFFDPRELLSAPEDVPSHYNPQLQMGLHLIDFLSYAFYVEAIYRRAMYVEGPSRAVGVQRMRDIRDASILDSGIIGIYQEGRTRATNKSGVYNFGDSDNDVLLCNVLSHQRDGAASFVPSYFREDGSSIPPSGTQSVYKSVKELPAIFMGKPLFGYMPWNLHGVHSVRVNRAAGFLTPAMCANAHQIAALVNRLMPAAGATAEQKISVLKELREQAARSSDQAGSLGEIDALIEDISAGAGTV
jgi:hypothetical protein